MNKSSHEKEKGRLHGLLLLVATLVLLQVVSAADTQPLRVVPHVDLMRYAGTWYEIARLPNRFQTRCAGEVKAEYVIREGEKISVLNSCMQGNGTRTEALGVAKRAGKNTPLSKLKVRFAPAFLSFLPQVWGDYNLIALDPDYRWAVVGSENRKYFWILSRTPQMENAIYERLVEEARQQGFDVASLQKTRQGH